MPLLARGRAAALDRLRTRLGHRVVTRQVAGANLFMPWSHRLPDYVRSFPAYGRNLIDLAELLAGDSDGPLRVVDIGANIGDSAMQILARVDARVLCVEGDLYWLPFLRRNTGSDARVEIEPALVVVDPGTAGFTAVREAGTTHFLSGTAPDSARQLSVDEIRAAHPEFTSVRLIKTDTDGHDCRLVPALARAWLDFDPVLFFEYDPELSERVGDSAPGDVWDELATLDYGFAAVWDNFGSPLGSGPLAEVAAAAVAAFERPERLRGYRYWDVAACRDVAAARLLARLASGPIPG